MSEKSIGRPRLVRRSLFAIRAPRADETDFRAIACTSLGIRYDQYPPEHRLTDPYEPLFNQRVIEIGTVEREGVAKHRRGLLKRDIMLLEVARGFPRVPFEHFLVYT